MAKTARKIIRAAFAVALGILIGASACTYAEAGGFTTSANCSTGQYTGNFRGGFVHRGFNTGNVNKFFVNPFVGYGNFYGLGAYNLNGANAYGGFGYNALGSGHGGFGYGNQLGFGGGFGGGYGVNQLGYGQYGSFSQFGTTVYGHRPFTVGGYLGNYDANSPSLAITQSEKLATGAQELAGNATTQANRLAQQQLEYGAQVQRAQVYGMAIRDAFDSAARMSATIECQQRQQREDAHYPTGNGGEYHSEGQPQANRQQLPSNFGALLTQKCADCHGNGSAPKGVSVDNWQTWDKSMRDRVLDSVTRNHNTMPQDAPPLNVRELAEFFKALDH